MKNKAVESVYLTKDKESAILGRGNDVGQYINVVPLNKLQRIPWSINEEVLYYIKDTLKEDSSLSQFEHKKRVNSFNIRNKETDDTINYLLDNGNKFYFNWRVDFRGRMYQQGYLINAQGNAYRKAMISFHDKEMLTSTGIQYLKYDIANALGYDKDTWFKRNVEANKAIAIIFKDKAFNENAMLTLADKADEPELFIKAIIAYKDGVILNKPIGHEVYLDASASGIQVLSTLAGCTIGVKMSNVNPYVIRTLTEEATARLAELERELNL